jgi:hypothetical protein
MSEKVKGGLGKAAFVMGIISVILALLPMFSAFFLLINWLVFVTAAVGIILGVLAITKNQQKAIVGTALNVIAIIAYLILVNSDFMAEKAAKDAAGAVKGAVEYSSKYSGGLEF